jgi:hypothetical protein
MKYFLAILLFLAGFTFVLLTTPAAHAHGFGGPGFFPQNAAFGCPNGFCGSGCFHPGFAPVFFQPVTPFIAAPVIVDDRFVFDNIYGPGASAARRLAPVRNSNFYHGW